jgi:hypothetical protein
MHYTLLFYKNEQNKLATNTKIRDYELLKSLVCVRDIVCVQSLGSNWLTLATRVSNCWLDWHLHWDLGSS